MQSSPALEAEIRERVDKLDRLYNHLVGCRVSVEIAAPPAPDRQCLRRAYRDAGAGRGRRRQPRTAPRARPLRRPDDVGIAIRTAFKTAERRLLDFKQKQRGDVKVHDEPFAGRVTQLYPDEDHGFLLTHEGTQLYFHRNSLVQRDFDRLEVGDRVHFIETVGDTGPIANKVWKVEGEPG